MKKTKGQDLPEPSIARVHTDKDRSAQAYAAMASGCGVALLEHCDRIILHGSDTAAFLNRLLTFDVKGMVPGDSARPFLLDAKGRIQLVMHLRRVADDVFVAHATEGHGQVIGEQLDLFHFGEAFQCEPASDWAVLQVVGPQAESVVDRAMSELGVDHEKHPLEWPGGWRFKAPRSGLADVELWVRHSHLEAVWAALMAQSAEPLDRRDLECFRVASGHPTHPGELGAHSSPLEAGGFDGISEGKGCYPGQEVIERTLALGRPPRRLMSIESAEFIAPGELHDEEGRAAGELTSVVALPNQTYRGLALIKQKYVSNECWFRGEVVANVVKEET